MKKWKAIISAFALSMCAAVTSVGFSEWLIQGSVTKSYGKDADKNARVVAYIQGRSEKFTTIEKAVNFANGLSNASNYTVVTVPYSEIDKNGKKKLVPIVISSSFTINSNVKLLFSFDGDVASTKTPDKDGTYAMVTDLSKTSLVNSAVVCGTKAKKVVITNNGTIEIGGELSGGSGGGAYAGHTAGRYAEVVLGEYSSIVNDGGTIDCFGYIREGTYNSSTKEVTYTHLGDTNANVGFVENKNGKFNLPFVLRDYRGGTSMVAVGNSIGDYHISAFNQIDIRNVTCKISFDYDSEVVGWANLRTGEALDGFIKAQMNSCDIRLIGLPEGTNKYLIEPTNAQFSFDAYYNPQTEVGAYDIYGGAQTNGMSLKVSVGPIKKDISTEDVFFPLSFRQKVILHKSAKQTSALFRMNQRFKIMSGSYFEIDKGARLELGEMCVYDDADFIDEATIGGTKYPKNKGDGILLVNGEFVANTFGGYCRTSSSGATVQVKTSSSVLSREAKTQEGSNKNPLGLKISETYDINKSLTLMVLQNSSDDHFVLQSNLSVGGYPSLSKNGDYGFATEKTMFKVNYHNVSSDSTFDASKVTLGNVQTELSKESTFAFETPTYADDTFVYDGIYLDPTFKTKATDTASCLSHLNANNEVDIYVRWSRVSKYRIVYSYVSAQTYAPSQSISQTETVLSDVPVMDSGYTISNPTGCADYEILNKNVYKQVYKPVSWILSDDSGVRGDVLFNTGDAISKSVIEQYDNDGVVRLVAKYECTNYLAMIVKNAKRSTWFGTWYAINVLKIGEKTQSVEDLNEHVLYVNSNDSVFVKTENGSQYLYEATLTVNGFDNYVFGNNTSTTLQLSRYKSAFDSLSGPIRLNGSVR